MQYIAILQQQEQAQLLSLMPKLNGKNGVSTLLHKHESIPHKLSSQLVKELENQTQVFTHKLSSLSQLTDPSLSTGQNHVLLQTQVIHSKAN